MESSAVDGVVLKYAAIQTVRICGNRHQSFAPCIQWWRRRWMKDCAKEERASEERETKEEGGRGKWRSHLAWRAVQPAAVASGKKHAAASNDRLIITRVR